MRLYLYVLLLVFSVYAIAADDYLETYRLEGSYFVRSSPDFGPTALFNKVGVLNKGSKFRVLSKTQKPNGDEELEIEMTGLSKDSYVKAAKHYYIYKPKRSKDFTVTSVAQTQADCPNCGGSAQPQPNPTAQNHDQLADVASAVIVQNNKPAPFVPPAGADPELAKKIEAYSNSEGVQKAIDWAMKNKSPRSRGYCYRTVKEALANQCGPDIRGRKGVKYHCKNPLAPVGGRSGPGHNLIPAMYSDLAASDGAESLKKYGFINLREIEPYKTTMTSPSQAPKGAVLVYQSGIPCRGQTKERDCGHIEIKTGGPGEPGVVSDYYSKDAINETANARANGTRYKLIGIMVKP